MTVNKTNSSREILTAVHREPGPPLQDLVGNLAASSCPDGVSSSICDENAPSGPFGRPRTTDLVGKLQALLALQQLSAPRHFRRCTSKLRSQPSSFLSQASFSMSCASSTSPKVTGKFEFRGKSGIDTGLQHAYPKWLPIAYARIVGND